MHPTRRTHLLPALLTLLPTALPVAAAAQDLGDLGPARPPMAHETGVHQEEILRVKFREGLRIRLRGGAPRDLDTGARALDPLIFQGAWRRTHAVSEARLEQLRDTARARLGARVADHNLEFDYILGGQQDPNVLIQRFHASPLIEYARPAALPVAPPLPGDFEPLQGYLDPATDGVGAEDVRHLPGGTGATMRVADIEYSWNLDHQDLPDVTLLGAAPVDPFPETGDHHGTAVLGVLVGVDNGWGVTGIAPDATTFVVGSNTATGYNPAAAITTAAAALQPGDVLLLEMQTNGPFEGNADLCPIEWILGVYNAIVTAVGNGIVVVEAAGNGGQDLDGPSYGVGNGGHHPFLAGNDSGAIIVGAGGSPAGFSGDRSRLGFSCYGSTVDLQGWGENVTTTGYGSFYNEGANLVYTSTFNGTSSASPTVAGACLLLQSMTRAETGAVLSPAEVKAYLIECGSPQLAGLNPVDEHIGPRPDVAAARPLALATWVDFGWFGSPFLPETGSMLTPYNTVDEGVAAAPSGGRIMFKPGSSSWTGTISKAVMLDSHEGIAVIGL